MDSFLQWMVCALTLAILLMVAGVEMNPGPVSVSYKAVNFARSLEVCANEDARLRTRHSEEKVRVGDAIYNSIIIKARWWCLKLRRRRAQLPLSAGRGEQ